MADFEFDGDAAQFELHENLKSVVIRRTGLAWLQLCWLFQKFYPKPLHIIDQAYSFELMISDFRSPDELRKAMLAARE